MAWLDAATVLSEAGHPDYVALGFNTQTELETHVTSNVIAAVQNLVEQYLGTTYSDSAVPGGVRSVALRAAAQALIKIGIRKKGALIRTGDYQVEVSKADILTRELKAELDAYRTGHANYAKATPYITDEIKETFNET